ncbi:MAG: glycosyltransferase family 2 protein [Leptospirales bacterium]
MSDLSPATKIGLVVLTLNPGPSFVDWLGSVRSQTLCPEHLLVIDSQSTDSYPERATDYGFVLHTIKQNEFGHGKTRQLALEILSDAEIVIFMTQDAVPERPDSFANLIKGMSAPDVGAAYGRQLPRIGASPIEAHARLFNYPDRSRVKSVENIQELGIKTPFLSNSFSAYKKSPLMAAGGFPPHLNFGEDVYVAARMILDGWRIAYVADATVYHSHRYSYREEWDRYLQVGRFYGKEDWIVKTFGNAKGEGLKFVLSELRYLFPRNLFLIPSSLFRTILKFVGYHVGKNSFFSRVTNGPGR